MKPPRGGFGGVDGVAEAAKIKQDGRPQRQKLKKNYLSLTGEIYSTNDANYVKEEEEELNARKVVGGMEKEG